MPTQAFEVRKALLKGILIAKKYHRALQALAFAEEWHDGFRKDGITPEFQHQVEQSLHALSLKDLIDEEGTIVTILLHDIVEDKPVPLITIRDRWGPDISHSVELMSVKMFGQDWRKNPEQYYHQQSSDPRASIGKGTDRTHNFNSMHGVFKVEKKREYVEETELYIIPMLKLAARNFPQQYFAYMSLRQTLKAIVTHVKAGLPEEA